MTLEIQTCTKCGSADVWWHYIGERDADGYDCNVRIYPPCRRKDEHLHLGCRRCNYQWSRDIMPNADQESKP